MKHLIDKDRYYNLTEILENECFPWIKSNHSLVKWIEKDRQGQNILKSQFSGEASGKRYFIKGENIFKFLAKWEDGSLSFEPRKEGDWNEEVDD